MRSLTSSFRIGKELHERLSQAAEATGKAKNAIIIEALARYLNALDRKRLAEEARRQSELVSRNEGEAGWYEMVDSSGWK